MRTFRLAPLDRKLIRELWKIRGQALAIALVIAAGAALYIMMLSTFESLELTQQTYYESYRFADVFTSLRRAPLRSGQQIGTIPGVGRFELRVVADVTLDIPDFAEPAVGRLIGIPVPRRPILCDLFLRQGRWVEEGESDQVIVAENFALAHELEPGDTIAALINGRRRDLELVGVALSPEYIYSVRPGELIPDDERFGVMWMNRRALAAAYDMEGAFNDVVLTLTRDASEERVMASLDRLLDPYGGVGAIPRRLQQSHFYLNNELTQLRSMGTLIPVIFLAVAAFLLNVVLSRMVTVQREEIAVLKAVGYSNREIALHFVKWSLVISAVGLIIGIGTGAWFGQGMTRMYADFFSFPILRYTLSAALMVQAGAISVGAAMVGTLAAVRRVVQLPPAEAMRPQPPATYRVSVVERAGLKRWLSQPSRMILRNLQRSPGRSSLSLVGIAAACGLLIFGTFSMDAMDLMEYIEFDVRNRSDVMVSFVEPVSSAAYYELQRLPGVLDVEPFRIVPARIRFGHRSRHLAITGMVAEPRLFRVIDVSNDNVRIPEQGLAISAKLAEILGATRGDELTIEVLEGKRPVRRAVITELVDDLMGINAYMRIQTLHRLLREGGSLSGAYLLVDGAAVDTLYHDLKNTPQVAGVLLKRAALESFEETLAEMFQLFRNIAMLFAAVIAFGVVYNSARISLSERSRELASLRVLGFTRGEISYILLGELVVITVLAIPVGMAFGYGLALVMVESMDTEIWRFPLYISRSTHAFAVGTIVAATAISSLIVRRRLDRLDLVEVLKTRE